MTDIIYGTVTLPHDSASGVYPTGIITGAGYLDSNRLPMYPDKPNAISEVSRKGRDGTSTGVIRTNLALGWYPNIPTIGGTETPVVSSFHTLFFNGLHLRPYKLNCGNMISEQTKPLLLWNASLYPVTITGVTSKGTEGMQLHGLPVPRYLLPLEQFTATVDVSIVGPPTINGEYKLTTDRYPRPHYIDVTGSRVLLFPIPPDTSKPYAETYSWTTSIQRAWDFQEQRASLRMDPRCGMQMTVNLKGRNGQIFRNLTWGWGTKYYAVPLWHHQQKLLKPVRAGESVLWVDTEYREFTAGCVITLFVSAEINESAVVQSLEGNKLMLTSPVSQDWIAGAYIYPTIMARMPVRFNSDFITSEYGTASLTFFYRDPSTLIPREYSEMYLGHPVMPLKPSWTDGIQQRVERDMQILESRTGVDSEDLRTGIMSTVTTLVWWIQGAANIHHFKQWVFARYGCLVPFWVPSFVSDFNLVDKVGSGDKYLTVEDNMYVRMVVDRKGRQDLKITTSQGIFYRRIRGVKYSLIISGAVELHMDAPLTFSTPSANVIQISLMHLSRLESDTVNVQWIGRDVAQVQLEIRTLLSEV